MSRLKLDQAIYYIGDDSELGTAQKLRENVAKGAGKRTEQIPLLEFGTKGQEVPDEIILLAHSDDTRQHIGDKTPVELARDLAKQFQGKDKTQLKSIKLVSCEGGFGDHPLALQVAQELHRQGFTNAVVKAATHPKESKIGGVVSVTTKAGISIMTGNEDGMVSAVMYGNQKTSDYIRYKELKSMGAKTTKYRRGRTEKDEQEMRELAEKYNDFKGFDEGVSNYCRIQLLHNINDLDAPYNCYTKDGVKAPLSLDAAIALDYLRDKRRVHAVHGNDKIVQYLDKVIEKINQNSAMKQSAIMQIFDDKQLAKGVSSKLISSIKEELPKAIMEKTAAMGLSKPLSNVDIIESKIEKDEDYLAKLVAKDGIFDKLWRSIYGAEDFTKNLRLKLKSVSTQTLHAKAEREDIKGLIQSQKEKDIESGKLVEIDKGFLGLGKTTKTDTPLKALYTELNTYMAKESPTKKEDWQRVVTAYQTYERTQPRGKQSTELEKLVGQLSENNKKYENIGKNVKGIKAQIDDSIAAYLAKYDKGDATDKTHVPKVAVMKAMQAYASEPTEKNYEELQNAAQTNPGWDKGWFSKVKFFMSEVQEARKEQVSEESRLSSEFNKGMK
ncbi:hypothetical protein [Legionella parisiensis]|uniref:Peptidase C80 domain-containing protein n=1 Tax=Legionella parisiensis TaxID=45071 RepID=A0A1E5JVS0_9GAMM|nr:hypothetical protein [Legionella parisiensis]KTD40473.1 hypothetical protein Lpar_1790 [Legionella parisiensis]OEH48473.1 hypothetical protein lpari_00548 [Legionella parisiensis]STX77092.1 Uncharacterised protein [Legionella parisiensis]